MKSITLVIKQIDSRVESVVIDSNLLPQLVNNIRLYDNNADFITEFLSKATPHPPYPSDDGMIVIDMVEHQILDSQGYTGIFKMTPSEIKSSADGNVVGETANENAVKRFKEALDANRLKGFEAWSDSGTQINNYIEYRGDEKELLASATPYGQFVFNTSPYTVSVFSETDYKEQNDLFGILFEKNFLCSDSVEMWLYNLERLKNESN